jgi:para-nitrobenzyl esterase
VYGYRFDWDEEPRLLGTDLALLLGAAHGFEIPFVFGNFDLGDPFFNAVIFNDENLAARERLAERIMGYWAEFARTGRPGRGRRDDSPEWLSWSDTETREVAREDLARLMILDTEADGGIRVASTRMTRDHVIAAVDSEPSLEQGEKCALFRDLFMDRPDWNVDEYRRIGRGGCADFPIE